MMTHTSRKRSRASNDEDASDFMPISKRINNLHIRSGTVLNSDDEGQEENSAEPAELRSACNGDVHPADPRFLSVNNSYQNAGMQATASTSTNHHPSAMECSGSSGMPALYANGHVQHMFHGGELQHPNGAASDGMCAMAANMQHWTNAQMYQGPVSYEPDLDESQNPYYYHVNEMLYDLHVARMQRLSKEADHLHLGNGNR